MGNEFSRPWSDEERVTLRQMVADGFGPVVIGRYLGRTKYSVSKQIQTLRLARRKPPQVAKPEPAPRAPMARPLPPGAHTLPPLPSEMIGATDG